MGERTDFAISLSRNKPSGTTALRVCCYKFFTSRAPCASSTEATYGMEHAAEAAFDTVKNQHGEKICNTPVVVV